MQQKINRLQLSLILGLIIPGSVVAACNSLQALDWLLGSWQAEQGKVKIAEHWQRLDATTFTGSGITTLLSDGSVSSTESMRLLQMQDNVFFLAKVSHNALPVAFKLTECDNSYARFENSTHDFPKQLEYRHRAGTLQVTVSAGADNAFSLHFVTMPTQ